MRDMFSVRAEMDRAMKFGNNGETDGLVLVRIDHGDRLSEWGKVFLSAADAGPLEARGDSGAGCGFAPAARQTVGSSDLAMLEPEKSRGLSTGYPAGITDSRNQDGHARP
jgi:hypothetical protein